MFYDKWYEKASKKNWEEMQKYKEFDKENFKGVDKFSNIFDKIYKFFKFSFISLVIVIIIAGLLIYLLLVFAMNARGSLWF